MTSRSEGCQADVCFLSIDSRFPSSTPHPCAFSEGSSGPSSQHLQLLLLLNIHVRTVRTQCVTRTMPQIGNECISTSMLGSLIDAEQRTSNFNSLHTRELTTTTRGGEDGGFLMHQELSGMAIHWCFHSLHHFTFSLVLLSSQVNYRVY